MKYLTKAIVPFDRNGGVVAASDSSSNVPLLGMGFNPADGNVYMVSLGKFQGAPRGRG